LVYTAFGASLPPPPQPPIVGFPPFAAKRPWNTAWDICPRFANPITHPQRAERPSRRNPSPLVNGTSRGLCRSYPRSASFSGQWAASDITLLQPLEFARFWRERVGRNHLGSVSEIGPSISDSSDYLARIAERGFANSPNRVCCATDSDVARSIVRLANSSAIDAVAIGLSNRWRMTRLLAAELNELLFRKVRKPVLLFGSPSR
jgi:hypothetical protein